MADDDVAVAVAAERILPAYHSIKHAKQRAFLMAYAAGGLIKESSRASHVSDRSHYDWYDKDELYMQAFEDIQPRVTQMLRDEVIRRPTNPKKPPDLMFIFEMKRRDPAYRDNYAVQVNNVGSVQINVTIKNESALRSPREVLARPDNPLLSPLLLAVEMCYCAKQNYKILT